MIFNEKDVNFKKLDDRMFEELCFDLLLRVGFHSLVWRQGGADSGRDIEGIFTTTNPLLNSYNEKWFIECKHYSRGIPVSELESKIAWADAYRPQHFLLITSAYLSNPTREWIEKIIPQKSYSIRILEGKQLQQIIVKFSELVVHYFINEYEKTLQGTIKDWQAHGILPSKEILYLISKYIDPRKLSQYEICFLICAYYFRIDEIEEWFFEEKINFSFDYLEKFLKPLKSTKIFHLEKSELIPIDISSTNISYSQSYKNCSLASFKVNKNSKEIDAIFLFLLDKKNSGIDFILYRNENNKEKIKKYSSNAEFESKRIFSLLFSQFNKN